MRVGARVFVPGVMCYSVVELDLASVPFQNWELEFTEQLIHGTLYTWYFVQRYLYNYGIMYTWHLYIWYYVSQV